jgi:UDP-N-acetylglucosamine 1-carboxyvinyltransferase
MEVLKIRGGTPLVGEVEIPGSKNAALALLSAVPLSKGQIVLHNVPDISDVHIKLNMLKSFGALVEWREGTLYIDASTMHSWKPEEVDQRPIRTGFYLLGPLLARHGRALLPMPGGCKIGARPVDYHLKGLAMLGAKIELVNGCYQGVAEHLKGAEIYFDFPSAGATQHLMATATLAEGVTTIQNAAIEPEVTALAAFLCAMGARIEGAGTSTITIMGVSQLNGCNFRVPADRMQAGTYLLAGAITRGDIRVTGILPEDQTAMVQKLKEAEITVDEGPDWVRVRGERRPKGIRIRTMPHPGFPTDIQQPMSALLAIAKGSSVIEETIYESRIGHVAELCRMGAQMTIQNRTTIIEGVEQLHYATVEASDLRAGAALILAGLAADGETTIKNIHFIDRGYEYIEQRLTSLGAHIKRTDKRRTPIKDIETHS